MEFLEQQKAAWELEREKLLRTNITNRYTNDGTWDDSIDIFNNIIKYRYTDPIDTIIQTNQENGEGFFILQNQVILIEILAAFQQGKIFQHDNNLGFYYNDKTLFIKFLSSNNIFSNVFGRINRIINRNNNNDNNIIYLDFYWNVRCGLVHQGILKKNWAVNTLQIYDNNDFNFIKFENGKKVIYRNILQRVLLKYIESYITLLRESTEREHLTNFARRLDCHFNITDNYFDW